MFTRIFIHLRWPLAAVVVLFAAAWLATSWIGVTFKFPLGSSGADVGGGIGAGLVAIFWDAVGPGSDAAIEFDRAGGWRGLVWCNFAVETQDPHWTVVRFPIWCAALPFLALACFGFAARQRQLAPGVRLSARHLPRLALELLVRQRWYLAALSVLAAGITVASGWRVVGLCIPLGANGEFVQAWVGAGRLLVIQSEAALRPDLSISTEAAPQWVWLGWSFGAGSPNPNFNFSFVQIPLWSLALPLAALAFAAFVAWRRQPKPGECSFCRHALAGATTCPECGRSAPSN